MPDLNLTQACVEVMTEEVIVTALALTQAPVEVIASEPNLAFSLSQLTLETMVPVDYVLSDSGALVSCFEIFPSEPLPETVVMTTLSMEVAAVEEIAGADCIPIPYDWVLPGIQKWTVNVDGTLYGADLIQPDSGMAALVCYFRTTHIDPDPEGKKWTITGVYRNDTNSRIAVPLTTMIGGDDGDYYELSLDHSLTSKRFHINLTSLYTVEFDSAFITDPHVNIGDPLPNTENWVECIRIEENDFGAESEAVIIYDD